MTLVLDGRLVGSSGTNGSKDGGGLSNDEGDGMMNGGKPLRNRGP